MVSDKVLLCSFVFTLVFISVALGDETSEISASSSLPPSSSVVSDVSPMQPTEVESGSSAVSNSVVDKSQPTVKHEEPQKDEPAAAVTEETASPTRPPQTGDVTSTMPPLVHSATTAKVNTAANPSSQVDKKNSAPTLGAHITLTVSAICTLLALVL